jgi:hypothetical protein
MINFAREKRRQSKPSFPGGLQPGSNTSNAISDVQELLNAAMPTPQDAAIIDWRLEQSASGLDSPAHDEVPGPDPSAPVAEAPTNSARSGLQRRESAAPLSAARLASSTVGSTSNSSGVRIPPWPVAHVQGLVNHCKTGPLCYSSPNFSQLNARLHIGHSLVFRACHPLYMISLLANRPSAENYPFFVDIDSGEDFNEHDKPKNGVQNQFYRLAESSSMLTHALLMVSASHLATLENEHATTNTRQAINHKSKALESLNEAIEGLPTHNYLETLATVAILASHEVRHLRKISITHTND